MITSKEAINQTKEEWLANEINKSKNISKTSCWENGYNIGKIEERERIFEILDKLIDSPIMDRKRTEEVYKFRDNLIIKIKESK